MKIVIDPNNLVSDETALKMVLQVIDREDGDIEFSRGFVMNVKSNKSGKAFKVEKQA